MVRKLLLSSLCSKVTRFVCVLYQEHYRKSCVIQRDQVLIPRDWE